LLALLVALSLPLAAVSRHEELPAQDKTATLRVVIVTDAKPGLATRHGLKQLKAALKAKGVAISETADPQAKDQLVIYAGLGKGSEPTASMLSSANIAAPDGAESFVVHNAVQKEGKRLLIAGGDDRGLMYGLLDVAERIGWAQGDGSDPLQYVRDVREKPDLSERGMSCHAMQQAYFESRLFNEDYWDRYFTMLARNRFNAYVMIFGYENAGYLAPPYPYFCDVDGFPDVQVVGWSKDQQERYLNALNRVIRQAHEHGIRFSVGIWDHIYRGGVQTGGAKESKAGRPGTVTGVTEKNLVPYTRKAFATLMQKLPELDGVQFRMHDESGLKAGAEMRQFWTSIFEDLQKSGRKLKFELRAKAMPDDIIDAAVNSGIDFRLSTRYWAEQMGLPFHPTHINRQNQIDRRHSYADLLKYPKRYSMLWQLWTGGTTRILLWGDPEYARRFAETSHLYDGDGFTVYEPLTTKMASHQHLQKPVEILNAPYRYYEYEFERYWHFFQCFGRIGYSPKTSPEVWTKEFERRFGKDAAPHVEAALHKASQILPRINAAIFPYNNFPTTYGWAEKQRKGDLPQYAKADVSDTQLFLTMDEAAKLMLEGGESAKVWPQQTSKWFRSTATDVKDSIKQAEQKIGNHKNKEFVSTMTDLKILSCLAEYHAARLLAGIHYAFYKRAMDPNHLDWAIGHENIAIAAWTELVKAAGDVYADDLSMGRADAGLSGHWKDELVALRNGLAALKKERENAKAPEVKNQPIPTRSKFDDPAPEVTHSRGTTAQPGKPLSIKAKVSDKSGGVKWARVLYRNVNQKEDYKVLPMKAVGKDEYEAVIPGEAITPTWDIMYLIEVMGNAGNGRIYPDFEKETPYAIVRVERP
jgi:hypothetical protein